MDQAHLHLLFNHFPIIGTIFGAMVLLAGYAFSGVHIKRVGLSLLILSSLLTIPSFLTGEGAEEIVEEQPGISHDIIHEHEEKAELFIWISSVMGVLALMGLFLDVKNKSAKGLVTFLALVLALVVIGFAIPLGNSGGAISHPELQEAPMPTD